MAFKKNKASMKIKSKKWHKWVGLIFTLFIFTASVSGILLNHRYSLRNLDINRSLLPSKYHFKNWNNGALKGNINISKDSTLLYGASGIWLNQDNKISNFSTGIKNIAEAKRIDNIVIDTKNSLFAKSTYIIYKYHKTKKIWENISDKWAFKTRISDITTKGDSLIVLTRSKVYISKHPYQKIKEIRLQAPKNYKNEISLFKFLWVLHSGELFGLGGQIIVDIVGLITAILSLTGLILFILPKLIKRKKKKKKNTKKLAKSFKFNFKWHKKLGLWFLPLLFIICITGAFLRPPLLVAIIRAKIPTPKFTHIYSENPWNEKLRSIRYDNSHKDWLVYTSKGMFSFKDLESKPVKLKVPPISPMGLNVMKQTEDNKWILGSFRGAYLWDRNSNTCKDLIKNIELPLVKRIGRPLGYISIYGYINSFNNRNILIGKDNGPFEFYKPKQDIEFYKMPKEIGKGRMSIWNTALEAHTGRIFLNIFGPLYVFIVCIAFFIIIITGYFISKKRKRKK